MEFPEGFAIARAIITDDDPHFYKKRDIVFYWNCGFYKSLNGWHPDADRFVHIKEYIKTEKYGCHWMMSPEEISFEHNLFEKVERILKAKHFSKGQVYT